MKLHHMTAACLQVMQKTGKQAYKKYRKYTKQTESQAGARSLLFVAVVIVSCTSSLTAKRQGFQSGAGSPTIVYLLDLGFELRYIFRIREISGCGF
jgi:hypothetical protein